MQLNSVVLLGESNPSPILWLIPCAVLILSSILAVVAFFYTRAFVKQALDMSLYARVLYLAVSVGLLPIIVGAWSDILDLTDVSLGEFTGTQSALLSGIFAAGPLYLYLHACWFVREEENWSQLATVDELNCQKNYLVRMSQYIRACIGSYEQRIRLTDSPILIADSARPEIAKQLVIETVRRAYQSLNTVPADSKVTAVLFRENLETRYLEHYLSYDGSEWGWFGPQYDRCREFFNLSQPDASVAVASVVTMKIFVVEDAGKAHDDHRHPFKFFPDELQQRALIGSALALPFELTGEPPRQRFVLCLTCSEPKAFLIRHEWKAIQALEEVKARIRLLHRQEELFHKVDAQTTDLQQQLQEATRDLATTQEQLRKANHQVDDFQQRVRALEEGTPADVRGGSGTHDPPEKAKRK